MLMPTHFRELIAFKNERFGRDRVGLVFFNGPRVPISYNILTPAAASRLHEAFSFIIIARPTIARLRIAELLSEIRQMAMADTLEEALILADKCVVNDLSSFQPR